MSRNAWQGCTGLIISGAKWGAGNDIPVTRLNFCGTHFRGHIDEASSPRMIPCHCHTCSDKGIEVQDMDLIMTFQYSVGFFAPSNRTCRSIPVRDRPHSRRSKLVYPVDGTAVQYKACKNYTKLKYQETGLPLTRL